MNFQFDRTLILYVGAAVFLIAAFWQYRTGVAYGKGLYKFRRSEDSGFFWSTIVLQVVMGLFLLGYALTR